MNTAETLLRQHQIRKTAFRIELLELFQKTKHALNANEISNKSENQADRATIYRTLMTFLRSGLIHKIPDANNNICYALCSDSSSSHKNHAHFICHSCQKVFCLKEVEVPTITTSEDFTVQTSNLTLEGCCPQCSEN